MLRSFKKELQKNGITGKVFATDAKPELSAACQVADHYFKVPRLDDPNYLNFLLEQCVTHEIKLIVPTIDTELLMLSKADKRVIHAFFESKDIQVAKEYQKKDYSLPLFIKPIDGSRSVDTYIIKNEEDLTDYHFENEKLMFLEYLDHG